MAGKGDERAISNFMEYGWLQLTGEVTGTVSH